MLKVSIFLLLFLTQFSSVVYAAVRHSNECYVFIDSSVPEQLKIFHQFTEEYYFSKILQDNAKVTFIDISNTFIPNTYIVPIINDSQGIWVRKLKPKTLPTVIYISQHKNSQQVITSSREIRKCLQAM